MKRHPERRSKKSPYITPEGFQALQAESARLWVKRRKVAGALAAAAAEGDRSENAEYIYRKKQLRELDHRIRYLQRRLPELKVINSNPPDLRRVFFGASVTLEDAAGNQFLYRIVGADEFDAARNWISVDSPMARALLKRTVDEEIQVRTPVGEVYYLICEVSYEISTGR